MTALPETAASPLPRFVWLVALLVLALNLATAGRYHFLRNELYFIDCSRHPGRSYVDQPALVPLTASLAQQLRGGAVVAAVSVASAIALKAITSTLGTSALEP